MNVYVVKRTEYFPTIKQIELKMKDGIKMIIETPIRDSYTTVFGVFDSPEICKAAIEEDKKFNAKLYGEKVNDIDQFTENAHFYEYGVYTMPVSTEVVTNE